MFAKLPPMPLRNAPATLGDSRSAIEIRFPRIAGELDQRWNGGKIDAYLLSLLMDERGNRTGFPLDVLEELMFLYSQRWQLLHPSYTRADEGLIEKFSFCADPAVDPEESKTVQGWLLA